ncbi:phosphatase PAP2 family protein [Enhydrobacter sp.]|jgi:undecaprenyl-diphosphatase|uniref:phosphatase PAP2 family protein n=1 Tax=Enhydrobacter sp. TaxID=1894999 RepID=UPI00262A8755|nr:phosphatase PAP2 family protein [Enhydrobacter sp.]WIM10740.1 MAG: hypothetical protein OJF58_001696 [Enhydrobacter sp.]
MNAITLLDRNLARYANQLAGHSIAFDKFVFDIVDLRLLNGGAFLAVFWWLWFEADKSGGFTQRRNVVVALLAAPVVGGVSRLLQVLLPFHHFPLQDLDLGLRMPFGVDPTSINAFSSFPSNHAALFFSLNVPLWIRSRWLGATATVWTLLVICLPLLFLGYHWPSDIIGGAAVGVTLMLLLRRLIGATRLPDRIVGLSAAHPSAFYALAWLFAFEIALLFADQILLLDTANLARAVLR